MPITTAAAKINQSNFKVVREMIPGGASDRAKQQQLRHFKNSRPRLFRR